MKTDRCKALFGTTAALAALILSSPVLTAQTSGGDDSDDSQVFQLSPFEVATSGDKGYYASNTISGSRISVPIQDIPLTIEVVTSEFIEDTGATDLRDSLKYSAGVLLQSQNDAFGKFDNAGNVNNPEGATGDRSESSFKIRGFVLENTLRNGYRRKNATDTINIDRIEVIRGPSALLYGVGNFGGVVNYLTKEPLPYNQQTVDLTIGSYNMKRASIDSTGPLVGDTLSYRLTMAYEDRDSWTDINTREHYFISPVLQLNLYSRVKVTLDYEYGSATERGISFQSVRTPSLEDVRNIFDTDQLETFGFLEFTEDKNANQILDPGEDLNGNGRIDLTRDPRTFRWSGPDTFLDTESWNANLSAEIKLAENLYYKGGFNKSFVGFKSRDVFGGITRGTATRLQAVIDDMAVGAEDLNDNDLLDPGEDLNGNGVLDFGRGIFARQIIDGKSSDTLVPIYGKAFLYNWVGDETEVDWIQHRHEVTFNKRIFEGNRWLESEHNFLLGYSYESQSSETKTFLLDESPDGDNFYYKDPTDESYIRFGPANPGDPDIPFNMKTIFGQTASNEGAYLVYSGRFLNDDLFVIAGIREDTTENTNRYFEAIGTREGRVYEPAETDPKLTQQTNQFGISYEVLNGVSLYALSSEGVEPNFAGQRDGNGKPFLSTVAEATEFGVKVNLFDGKIAGTFSKFNIRRNGFPIVRWWAPAPFRGSFKRDQDIIYRMDEWNPESNPDNVYLNSPEALAAWAAGRAGDDPAIKRMTNEAGNTFMYLNASRPEGAAYLDAVFNALKAAFEVPPDDPSKDADPFPGWLYWGAIPNSDSLVNTASEDIAAVGDGNNTYIAIDDEADGYEAQVILSPLDNLQIIINYSHVERKIINPGEFVQYDFEGDNWDRWAPWYFPNLQWGLGGVPTAQVYPDGEGGNLPNRDTSTWTGVGWGEGESLDDTPEDTVSWWANYSFTEDSRLAGLEIGFGGQWESKREYASAFTTAGQKKLNRTGNAIKAFTDERLTVNAMIKYSWSIRDKYDAVIQLNVDNLLDDKDQYGFIYAPGMSWKLNFGMTF